MKEGEDQVKNVPRREQFVQRLGMESRHGEDQVLRQVSSDCSTERGGVNGEKGWGRGQKPGQWGPGSHEGAHRLLRILDSIPRVMASQ